MRAWLAVLLMAWSLAAHAHKPSDSYLALRVDGATVHGQWDIALRDLEFAIGLDANDDGAITWGELKARHADIAAYALTRLKLEAAGQACAVRPTEHLVDDHTDGAYAVLRFVADCPAAASPLGIRYSLFFDLDPTHKGLLRFEQGGVTTTGVFSPDKPAIEIAAGKTSRLAQFLDYGVEGVWHIWIGIDHILFLLSLLLPAVEHYRNRRWEPAAGFREVFWDVLKVVTAFTVAHSITLSLAALGVIDLPSRFVESAIAASVVLAALNNLMPVVQAGRWMVAFGFGLIHGFGFASVLADLGLPRDALVLALVGFNVGVELGQLVIVLAFLPFAFALRGTAFYRRVVLTAGSLAIAVIAAGWFVERAFDLKLLPF